MSFFCGKKTSVWNSTPCNNKRFLGKKECVTPCVVLSAPFMFNFQLSTNKINKKLSFKRIKNPWWHTIWRTLTRLKSKHLKPQSLGKLWSSNYQASVYQRYNKKLHQQQILQQPNLVITLNLQSIVEKTHLTIIIMNTLIIFLKHIKQ